MSKDASGFTRIELLVILATCAVILIMLVGILRPARHVRSQLTCALNLKQFVLAAQIFKEDRLGFPWMVSTNYGGTAEFDCRGDETFRHFQVLSNNIYITIGLVCPQDSRQPATNWANLANINVSYFIGLDGKTSQPTTILAGDRNITSTSGVILLTGPAALPKWVKSVGLHGDKGHLAFGDGHVEEANSDGLARAVYNIGVMTNHFSIP